MTSDHKIIWTVLVLGGLLANLRTLSEALGRRRRLRESGRNGPLRLIAWQGVRGEAAALAVQCLLTGLCAGAWHLDEPEVPGAVRLYLIGGWTLAGCSVLLTVDSLMDLADRRRLTRLLTPRPADPKPLSPD